MSCSTVHFKSKNQGEVTFDYRLNRDKEVTLEVEKKFYMWGLYPKKHEVLLDQVFSEKGFDSVSDLRIEEVETLTKALWMVGSLGMYYPQTFRLIGRISE